MKSLIFKLGLVCIMLAIILPVSGQARTALEVGAVENYSTSARLLSPVSQIADHRVGKIQLSVTNIGTIGDAFVGGLDAFTGEPALGCVYPKGSSNRYLFGGAFWIGAVVDGDTLVSVGADGWIISPEMHPDDMPLGYLVRRSINDPITPNAISEDDIIAVYYDTLTGSNIYDEIDGRFHRPLGIKITQNSYAWSYPHVDDFVLFDM